MNNAVYILVVLNICIGLIAIYLSYRDEKQRAELLRQKRELTRRYYEALVLQDISTKIGYSFNVSSIAETIVLSVEKLFDLSTISYATIEDEMINIKTFQKEAVGERYLQAVRNILCASIYEINPLTTTHKVHETAHNQAASKDYINIHYDILPKSYFNIPLVVNKVCVGVITITSRNLHAYDEEDMSTLYKTINQAEIAVERLENVIETEKKKLAALISGIPSGAMLFIINNDSFNLETINSAARNFLGFREADPVDTFRVVGRFGASAQIDKYVMEAVRDRKSIILSDITIQNKFFKIYINPIPFYENDVINGVTVSLEDITVEKEIAEIRDSFTNMVVHELRSPMTSIKGAAGLVLGGKLTDEEREKMLRIVRDSADRMLTQINDLLDAAKLQAGKFQITEENWDVNKVIDERVEAFKFLAETKKISVVAEMDKNIPEFRFDKIRIDQVITNLMSNSLKFTPEGGTITVKSQLDGGSVRVAVTDTGIGIPEDKQSLLFSKYTQVQTIFRKDGTGLGLFICKGIIESHGGKVWIESKEGQGTTIAFTIPLIKAETVSSDSAQTAQVQPQVAPVPAAHQYVN